MSKLTYTNIAGEKCHCGCTQYEECGMECSLYRKIIGKQTNADRVRAMSDEELATFFGTLPCCPPGNADELCFPDNTCGADTKMMVKCWGTWLKATVEEADNG